MSYADMYGEIMQANDMLNNYNLIFNTRGGRVSELCRIKSNVHTSQVLKLAAVIVFKHMRYTYVDFIL